jgi:HEAT repeat protein
MKTLILVLLAQGPPAQENRSADLETLIERLSSEEEAEQEEAGRRLQERVPDLLKRLDHAPPDQRARSIWALSRINAKGVVPDVVKCLADIAAEVRSSALMALEQLRASPATGAVASLLSDPDGGVRRAAIRAVRALRCREAAPALRELLRSDQVSIRTAAVEALAKVDAAGSAVDLVRLLQDPADDIARCASETLGALGTTSAARALADAASRGAETRVAMAVDALAATGVKEFSADLLRLAQEDRPEVRAHAIRALARLGIQEGRPAIERGLKDRSPGVRFSCAEAAAELVARDFAPAIGELLQDRDDAVRTAAIYALGDLGIGEALPDILPCILDENSEVAAAARWTVARLGTRAEVEQLVFLTKLPASSARREAVRTLGVMEAEGAAGPIARMLEDSDRGVQRAAIEALARVHSPESVPALVRFSRDHPGEHRHAVLTALVNLPGREAEDLLRGSLGDPDPETRVLAAALLARRGVRDGAPVILRGSRTAQMLNPLNALRQPEMWRLLGKRTFPGTVLRGRRRELLGQIARSGGWALELPTAFTRLEDLWLDELIMKRPDRFATTRELLEDLMGEFDLKSPYGWVLEPGVIRMLPAVELPGFWSDWWHATERRSK